MGTFITKEQELESRLERLESIILQHTDWINLHVAGDKEFAEKLKATMEKHGIPIKR